MLNVNKSHVSHVKVTCHCLSPSFYLSEGFLHLENAVGLSIIEYLAAEEGLPVPEVTVETRVGRSFLTAKIKM